MVGRRRGTALLVSLAVVGLPGCGLTPIPHARPTVTAPAPEASSVLTVIGGGNLYVYGTNTNWTVASGRARLGDTCSPAGAFVEAGNGGIVIVRDRNDLAVASSTLGEGTATAQTGQWLSCTLSFIVEVPSGRGPYTFEIGNFRWAPMTQAQMLAGWTFTLGKR